MERKMVTLRHYIPPSKNGGGDQEKQHDPVKKMKRISRMVGKKEPWEMSREEFNNTFRTVRHFQNYTPGQRAERMASFRGGHRQREAIGEYFYTHELEERNIAYPSPKEAKERVRRRLVEKAIKEGKHVPLNVIEGL